MSVAVNGHWRSMFRIISTIIVMASLGCDGSPTAGADQPPSEPAGPIVAQPSTFNATVTINPAVLHQEMQGFGGSMRIFSDPHLIGKIGPIENSLKLNTPDENAILESVYRTIGLTRVRAVIQSNGSQASPGSVLRTDWVFGNGHIDLVKRAQVKGLRSWWLSPVALEPWMDASRVEAYSDWAMSEIRYWKSQGAELTWYSIANEPALLGVSGTYLRDAVKIIGRQLIVEGIKTRLVIPDDLNPSLSAAKARIILSDPEARQYVAAIATHMYGTPTSDMRNMQSVSEDYKIPLWMSEFSVPGTSPMAWASIVARLISDYDVAAIDYMWGFFGSWDEAQLVVLNSAGTQFTGATLSPAGYAMAQYARYVLPGARRVDLQSSDSTIRVSAFLYNGKVTIVALNEGTAATAVRFTLGATSAVPALRLVRTAGKQKLADMGRVIVTRGAFNLELPPASISTLIQ